MSIEPVRIETFEDDGDTHRNACDQAVMRMRKLIDWYRGNIGDNMADDKDETVLTDLLADLRHWADASYLKFEICDEWAKRYYSQEIAEK